MKMNTVDDITKCFLPSDDCSGCYDVLHQGNISSTSGLLELLSFPVLIDWLIRPLLIPLIRAFVSASFTSTLLVICNRRLLIHELQDLMQNLTSFVWIIISPFSVMQLVNWTWWHHRSCDVRFLICYILLKVHWMGSTLSIIFRPAQSVLERWGNVRPWNCCQSEM